MRQNLFTFLVFASLVASSVSLNCYSCMSSREGNCDDEHQMETKDCVSTTGVLETKAVCLKIVKMIRGFEHITRSCGYEGSLAKPCDAFQSAEHCSLCDSDLCNSSRNLIFDYSLLFVSFVIVTRDFLN